MIIDIVNQPRDFFKVLFETDKTQLATMTLKPGQDSGSEEIHKGDQILYVIEGHGEVEIEGVRKPVSRGQVVLIEAGKQHHVYNVSEKEFFCLNIYAPPEY
ncbi:MAG TPA: cupin domain-containing protein [Verrucomicrobiae bacterium]|nr:cupin domain-containing protein [Verrucomicrobiae bacterium]